MFLTGMIAIFRSCSPLPGPMPVLSIPNTMRNPISGRHLNALLTAEAIVGIHADEEVIQKHAAAAFYSFGGPIPLPLNRISQNGEPVGEPVRFLDHNIREGMHALYALSRYRKDQRADELMHRAIAFISEHFIPEMEWDKAALERLGLIVVQSPCHRSSRNGAGHRSADKVLSRNRLRAGALACNGTGREALKSYPPPGVRSRSNGDDSRSFYHSHHVLTPLSLLKR